MLVFGHRGACGYLPENTMESLELAFDQGADAVEFDVVFTKDGHPVIRHDLDLVSTTDIGNHSFLSTKVDELTLEDLQRLRAKERYPDGQDRVGRLRWQILYSNFETSASEPGF